VVALTDQWLSIPTGRPAVLHFASGIERVVLALGMAAQVFARDILVGFASDAGAFIIGVTHTRGGEPGQPGVEVGAQLRRSDQLADAHPVGPLRRPGEAAVPGAVNVGEFSVGID